MAAPLSCASDPPLSDAICSALKQVRDDQLNITAFSNLVFLAVSHVSKGGAKSVHQFCTIGGPPDFELQSAMLRTFSFRAKDQIQLWRDSVAKSIYGGCLGCYKGFLHAKHHLRNVYLTSFPQDKLDTFFSFLDSWEQEIALNLLKTKNVGAGTGLGTLLPSEIYSVLSLAASDSAVQLLALLKQALTLHQLTTIQELPAGLLVLAVDDDPMVRAFAAKQMAHLQPLSSSDQSSNPLFHNALIKVTAKFNHQASSIDWSILPIILRVIPIAANHLIPSVLNHVHDRAPHFSHVLKAYSTLLKLQGSKLWTNVGQDDPEYPTFILSGILDNPFFTQPMIESKSSTIPVAETTLWFGWMALHLDSLKDVGLKPFHEALKRLANFLFERLQQGHVPNPCRTAALRQAIDLILHHADEASSRDTVDLYASPISQLALGASDIDLSVRTAAQELVYSIFQRDVASVSEAIERLSFFSSKYIRLFKLRIKSPHDSSCQTPNPSASADEIYIQASNDAYPRAVICAKLWTEAYSAFGHTSGGGVPAASTFLKALSASAVFTTPSPSTHLLRQVPQASSGSLAFDLYQSTVRQSVSSIVKALKTMRQDFADKFSDFGDLAKEQDVQSLCISNVYSLLLLNLSPEVAMHKPAQNLLRQAFTDVETRADCFRILFQLNPAAAMRGVADYLQHFVDATNRLIEANDLAKWMVRSFADILGVMCGTTDGLFRPGTPLSLVEDHSKLQTVALKLPPIWRLMCQSVASIFRRTPQWSNLLAREEMLAWFRDVTIFATEMVQALPVFRNVVKTASNASLSRSSSNRKDSDPDFESSEEEAMITALALPLESAISWLRMNEEDILRETQSFIIKALDHFNQGVELPSNAKERMLKFINEQMAITDPRSRHTLLTVEELTDLKLRLDPSAGAIQVSDDDEDDTDTASFTSHPKDVKTPANDNSHWWSGVGVFGFSSMASSQQKKNRLKQQKLSFGKVDPSQVIDVDQLDSAKKKKPLTLDVTSNSKTNAQPAFQPPPKAPINAYKGSSSRPATPNGGAGSTSAASRAAALPKAGTGKLAQLRQELGSARTWRPQNVNVRPPAARTFNAIPKPDEQAIVAPAAVSSVTGAMIGKATTAAGARAAGKEDRSASSSSSSGSDTDSSDEEKESKGLAALGAKTNAAKTIRPLQKLEKRQLKVLDSPLIVKARRERQDAERKRILRSPPDYAALHRSILSWDYFYQGEKPPAPSGKEPIYRHVPPVLANASEYGSGFGPLLLLECWAQFQQAKEANESSGEISVPIEVAGRSTVDHFVDVNVTIPPNAIPVTYSLGDADVVRLSERAAVQGTKVRTLLAKVEAFKRHPQGHQVTLRCCLAEDKQGVNSVLVNRSKWQLEKLFSLTTLHREFVALMTVAHFDLFPDILKARLAPKTSLSSEEVSKAVQGYGINEPQARAVLGSLSAEGFSLIQGPPGTGKTKTICALIGAFISRRKSPTASIQVGRAGGIQGPAKKILVCAPSNAAIDEVAKRAKLGMRNAQGKMIYPKVVRVGRGDNMNVSVKDISLDYLIEQRMGGFRTADPNKDAPAPVDPSALHGEIHALKRQREEKQAELSSVRSNPALAKQLEAEIRNISAKRMAVMSKLDEAKDMAQTSSRQREADRRRARTEILTEADVICTTLSGAGHELLNSVPYDFETVVIDEAAQAVELSTIIPLRYGCKQCIMVGDPNQLPPTVISQQAERLGYSQSLFVRMFQQTPNAVHLLSIQYRMHPQISIFPSKTFYDSKLQDGPNMAQLTAQPWHKYELTRPFKFFSTQSWESQGRGHSYVNRDEAKMVLALYERLRQDYPNENFDYRIGIVTMYKAQVVELKRTFASRYGGDIHHRIDFNTVDGFQGQEKDIIILSCVRSSQEPKPIGFLSDKRRVNVAVTRAKSNLFIIGNAQHLKKSDSLWNRLVTTAEECGALQTAHLGTFSKSLKLVESKDVTGPPRPPQVAVKEGNGMQSKVKPPNVDANDTNQPARRPVASGSNQTKVEPRKNPEPFTASETRPLPPNRGQVETNAAKETKRKGIAVLDERASGLLKKPRTNPNDARANPNGSRANPNQPRANPNNPSRSLTHIPHERIDDRPKVNRRDVEPNISVGIPVTSPNINTGAKPGKPNHPQRHQLPPKPSRAALNAMFVTKPRR